MFRRSRADSPFQRLTTGARCNISLCSVTFVPQSHRGDRVPTVFGDRPHRCTQPPYRLGCVRTHQSPGSQPTLGRSILGRRLIQLPLTPSGERRRSQVLSNAEFVGALATESDLDVVIQAHNRPVRRQPLPLRNGVLSVINWQGTKCIPRDREHRHRFPPNPRANWRGRARKLALRHRRLTLVRSLVPRLGQRNGGRIDHSARHPV